MYDALFTVQVPEKYEKIRKFDVISLCPYFFKYKFPKLLNTGKYLECSVLAQQTEDVRRESGSDILHLHQVLQTNQLRI